MTMKIVPHLIRPRLVALRHRLFDQKRSTSIIFRDMLMLCFGLCVMYAVYHGTYRGLVMLEDFEDVAYLSPSIPFSILFLMLFMMLLISNSITALGSFFLARDLELILSAPFSRFRFFTEKLISIIALTSWMPLLFLIPFFIAYGQVYDAPLEYVYFIVLGLPPYILIASLLAVLFITLFTALVPARRTKAIFVLVLLLFLGLIYGVVQLVGYSLQNREDMSAILRILTVISFPDTLWLPSHWFAISLREVLERRIDGAIIPLALLYSAAFTLYAFCFVVHGALYERAYSRACNNQHQPLLGKNWSAAKTQRLFSWLPEEGRAVLLKEYRSIIRDMPQLVQLLLLIGICSLYLYNLRVFRMVNNLPVGQQVAWLAFLFIANASMSAFVTTAASTRLVFPSVSHEGKGFWILQSSPQSIRRIMDLKFYVWLVPVSILSSLVFVLGAIVIKASLFYTIVAFCSGIIVSFTIVSYAVGLGAFFADFSWEHTGQLVASFGSLVFMLVSIMTIAVQMFAVGLALFVRRPGMMGEHLNDFAYAGVLAGCVVILYFTMVFSRRIVFGLGERALIEKG